MNKYGAKRTWSNLAGRWFASRMECVRGEELHLLWKAGEIRGLFFQRTFQLSDKPRVTITIDFAYEENGVQVYEDTKGVLTRDFRTKLAWLKQLHNIDVILSGG